MPKFDLNSPVDFARVTSGNIAGLLGLFGRDPKQWDIMETSFRNVTFHIFENREAATNAAVSSITDSGGRRKVKYLFPYVDGQTTDDLGEAPESFSLDCLFFGPRYKQLLKDFLVAISQPTPATLRHPVRGDIECVAEKRELIHAHDKRLAVEVKITFIQHSFTIAQFGTIKDDKTVKGALARALDGFRKIAIAIEAVKNTTRFANSLKESIVSSLNELTFAYGTTLTQINRGLNPDGSADIPGLLPRNEGGSRESDGTTIGTFPVVQSPNEAFASVPSTIGEDAPETLSTQDIQREVNDRLAEFDAVITQIDNGAGGVGSLEFEVENLGLREAALLLLQAFQTGVSSSRERVVEYEVPRLMSLREVAFENGLSADEADSIFLLNRDIPSHNYIGVGTILQVPVNR